MGLDEIFNNHEKFPNTTAFFDEEHRVNNLMKKIDLPVYNDEEPPVEVKVTVTDQVPRQVLIDAGLDTPEKLQEHMNRALRGIWAKASAKQRNDVEQHLLSRLTQEDLAQIKYNHLVEEEYLLGLDATQS